MSALLHRINPENVKKFEELCEAVFLHPLKNKKAIYSEDNDLKIPMVWLGSLGWWPIYETLVYHITDKLYHYYILHRVPSEKEKAEAISKMFLGAKINSANRISLFSYQWELYQKYKPNFIDLTNLEN